MVARSRHDTGRAEPSKSINGSAGEKRYGAFAWVFRVRLLGVGELEAISEPTPVGKSVCPGSALQPWFSQVLCGLPGVTTALSVSSAVSRRALFPAIGRLSRKLGSWRVNRRLPERTAAIGGSCGGSRGNWGGEHRWTVDGRLIEGLCSCVMVGWQTVGGWCRTAGGRVGARPHRLQAASAPA